MESFQGVICDGGDVFATGEGLEDIIVHKCVGCKEDLQLPILWKAIRSDNIDFYEGSQTSKKFECETCGKECAKKCELKRHILSVHNEHSYHCSVCDMKFGTWYEV